MKRIYIILAGLALCLSSCNKESITSSESLSATASIDQQNTKTTYQDNGAESGLKVDWSQNESFTAYYEGGSLTFNRTSGSAFVATDVPAGVSASTPFVGVYGEKVTAYDYATGTVTIDYSNQDGTLENLAKYDAMVATSTVDASGLHFPFAHKSAFLRITLQDDPDTDGSHRDEDSTDDGRKFVKLSFKNCNLLDEKTAVQGFTSGSNFVVSFNLASELTTGERRVVYVAIPAMKLQYKSTPFGGTGDIIPEGYFKSVSSTSTKTVTFEAGKVYETSITYFCGTSHNMIQW
ncbi:MAG: hypothetical protein MJY86_08095 [Bacteroidales bacterium]|nr:hypothetical protein [Bacteroidales bacterium]